MTDSQRADLWKCIEEDERLLEEEFDNWLCGFVFNEPPNEPNGEL